MALVDVSPPPQSKSTNMINSNINNLQKHLNFIKIEIKVEQNLK